MVAEKRINDFDVAIGKALKNLRTLDGKSQQEIGDIIDVSFQQIQKIECGINRISAGNLMQIANAMGRSVTDFYYNEDYEIPCVSNNRILKLVRSCNKMDDVQLGILCSVARQLGK
jgi:transcriptional regulator with XRE-family HTH domain